MIVAGLDVSTKLGFVVLDQKGTLVSGTVTGKETNTSPKTYRIERWGAYADYVLTIVNDWGTQLVVIESYSHQSRFVNHSLFELGGIIRHELLRHGLPVIEMSPSGLKKFVTGSGNAKKVDMIESVEALWGFETKDDNQADAYGLAKAGLALNGHIRDIPLDRVAALDPMKKVQGASRS